MCMTLFLFRINIEEIFETKKNIWLLNSKERILIKLILFLVLKVKKYSGAMLYANLIILIFFKKKKSMSRK